MRVFQVIAATLAVPFVVCADAAARRDDLPGFEDETRPPVQITGAPVIEDISFAGLRRIAPQAVLAQMTTRTGEPLDLRRLADDVHRLGRLEWFAAIRIEELEGDAVSSSWDTWRNPRVVRLRFCFEEHPYLTAVDYSDSRLLSEKQIEKLLADKKAVPQLGHPENPLTLWQAASAIQSQLVALGHFDAKVELRREESTNGTVQVRFAIVDGPYLPVRRVTFGDESKVPAKTMQRQMDHVRPSAFLAGLRRKNVFSQEALNEDRELLLAYYQNHGYPEARIGEPKISRVTCTSWGLWPRPRRTRALRLEVAVPVEAGSMYRMASVKAGDSLYEAAIANNKPPTIPKEAQPGRPYSQRSIETLRRTWQARVQPKPDSRKSDTPSWIGVEAGRTMDPDSHTVRVLLDRSETPPYIVQSLEFKGLRRFPDRYLRRRFPLKEGAPFDDRALETGLARLARTTYFKPVKKEDVRVVTNDVARTAKVTVNIEEVGQQRVSLVGGRGQFGSTLGIAYTVFNLFHGEELLSSQFEGGPESLQLILGFAKEGFFGSRGSLALSMFDIFLRPRLSGTAKGPFFKQESVGANATWSYALTNLDSLNVTYGQSHAKTLYSPVVAQGLNELVVSDVRSDTSSHAVGLGWAHTRPDQRISFSSSVSGGWLGGTENVVRSKAEYERAWHDPVFDQQNALAFRTTFSGAGSYSGDLPFYARRFAGDDLVRGLRGGALGSQAVVSSVSCGGATTYSASPAGADLVAAANGEYRVPLSASTEASGFFDIGWGALLPNWLGPARPALIDSTSRIVHASTGIQLQWTIPGVGVPVRAYYALNLLRLDRWLPMPDGSLFHARDPLAKLGWGLGPMF
jgi:outer membrane protein assembly complex protein YaeT